MNSPAINSVDIQSLGPLWASELDPLFWRQLPTDFPEGWYAHVPFAFWVVGAAEPGILVGLGPQVAYFAFCEAVRAQGLNTLCYAVDAWEEKTEGRLCPGGVYEEMRRYNDARYPAFSELLRCTFDEARAHFADGSVDFLHINGLRTAEAVRHEIEAWRPRLSNRAVVLLDDINVRRDGYGTWRFWEEVRSRFPAFEFLHGNGLGVLAVGSSPPAKVAALCALRDPIKLQAVRERFSFLGERWDLRHKLDKASEQERKLAAAYGQAAFLENEQKHLQAALTERDNRIAALETELAAHRKAVAEAARQSAAEAHLRARAAERATRARAETTRALVRTAGLPGPPSSFLSAKVRFVCISGEPDTPGHLYRVIRPMEAFKALGVETSWMKVTEIPQRLKEVAAAHVLVIWRAGWEERLATAVETAHRCGARVVFDVDDLMVDPELARLEIIDGIRTQGLTEGRVQEHYARFHTTMLAADFCTAPTEELARHLRRFFRPTLVLPNGFDHATYRASRQAVRRRRAVKPDGCIRIGYASGTRTHQRDFAVAVEAIAQVLRDRPQCRLVLFHDAETTEPSLDPGEFESLHGLSKQIEWRDLVPLPKLPGRLAEFDINLAPLEVGNPFCEAKSELKFVEASLVDVPTVASPTGPYRRAIHDGVTGFLAEGSRAWHQALLRLVDDAGMRHRIARAAHQDVLWRFGPLRRADLLSSALPQFQAAGRQASRAFALELARAGEGRVPNLALPPCEVVFEANAFNEADVSVVVPLHNYARYVEEALESVRVQTLELLDVIVVDDASADDSLAVALAWAKRHAPRFNRTVVLRNLANAGLGPTRNAGIDCADTPYVLPLDADNRLLPGCAAASLEVLASSDAAFAFFNIQAFGESANMMGGYPFEPARFIGGNYIDAMALVSKEAWAAVGGYGDFRMGWEDFDFWCRLVEKGLWGSPVGDAPLAEYRVHQASMLKTTTTAPDNLPQLMAEMEARHPWLRIVNAVPAD